MIDENVLLNVSNEALSYGGCVKNATLLVEKIKVYLFSELPDAVRHLCARFAN